MKTFQATFLSLLITSIMSARAKTNENITASVEVYTGTDKGNCVTSLTDIGGNLILALGVCGNDTDQLFQLDEPGQIGQIFVAPPNFCLTVASDNNAQSSYAAEIVPCNPTDKAQLFLYTALGDPTQILSESTKTCLTVENDVISFQSCQKDVNNGGTFIIEATSN